jgi:lipopolysaccharide assembly outer membrane protein LptD (OstA)
MGTGVQRAAWLILLSLLGLGPLSWAQVAAPAAAAAPAIPTDIETTAEKMDYNPETQDMRAQGQVKVKYQDIVIEAAELVVNVGTYNFSAQGAVKLQRGDFHWSGEEISGNLRTFELRYGTHEMNYGEWQIKGEGAEGQWCHAYEECRHDHLR